MDMVNMLAIVRFLLRFKLINFLEENKKAEILLVNVFFFIMLIGNVLGLGYLIDFLKDRGESEAVDILLRATLAVFFAIPIFLVFFPSFKRKTHFFNELDPVGHRHRSAIEIICNFLSFTYLSLLSALSMFTLFSPLAGTSFLLEGFISLFASSICCLFIQHIFSFKFSVLVRFLYLGAIAVILCLFFIDVERRFLIKAGFVVLLTVSYLYVPRRELAPNSQSLIITHRKPNLFLLLIAVFSRTFAVRVNLLLALFLKFIFLAMFLSKPSMANQTFVMMVGSSLILFTYVYNNAWGYLRATFNNLALKRDLDILFLGYLCILSVPVAIDLSVSLSLWIAFGRPPEVFLLIYVSTLLLNIMIGFYSSVVERFEVVKAINLSGLKSNTPLMFNILSIISTVLVVIAQPTFGLAWTSGLAGAIALLAYYRMVLKRGIQEHKRDIYANFI